MPHSVRLSNRAARNRNDLWLYVAENNLSAADKLLQRFEDAFRLLSENPEAGRARPDLGDNIRTFAVAGHVICCRPDHDAITVAAIFHGARNITRRLLDD